MFNYNSCATNQNSDDKVPRNRMHRTHPLMKINITDLKECEKHLGIAILDNMDLTGTDFYHHLCLAISEIQWVLQHLEKGHEPKDMKDYDQ